MSENAMPENATIERYVYVRLSEQYTAEREDVAAHTRKVLAALPQVLSVSVGIPADDHADKAWDLSIALRFASLADVEAYRVHPDHRRYVDDYLRPRMKVIKAWNFVVS